MAKFDGDDHGNEGKGVAPKKPQMKQPKKPASPAANDLEDGASDPDTAAASAQPGKNLSSKQKAAMRHKDDKDNDNEPMHPAKAVFKAISKAPKYQGK